MRFQRKRMLIHRLQLRYSIYIAMAMMAVMFLTILNTYVDMTALINTILAEKGRAYILFLDLITPLLLIKICLITIVIILLGVLLSHRFVGPLYRFNQVFQKIGQGQLDIGAINLRQTDELKEEAKELTAMIKNLSEVISNIKADIRSLSTKQNSVGPEGREIIERLRQRVSFFKTQ